jgi:hypothetical protein
MPQRRNAQVTKGSDVFPLSRKKTRHGTRHRPEETSKESNKRPILQETSRIRNRHTRYKKQNNGNIVSTDTRHRTLDHAEEHLIQFLLKWFFCKDETEWLLFPCRSERE